LTRFRQVDQHTPVCTSDELSRSHILSHAKMNNLNPAANLRIAPSAKIPQRSRKQQRIPKRG
jgi:hypothetical protein